MRTVRRGPELLDSLGGGHAELRWQIMIWRRPIEFSLCTYPKSEKARETGALFGYTWDMVKGTITDSFDSMGTWFGNLGKKIYNSETGELFGYQLPTLPSLSDIGIWFTDLEKKIYNPETGELFGYQLPAMPSLSDIGTWFTDLGNKVYNGETNSLFGYQLPELPTLSTMFDKIKEIRNID